MTVLNSAWFSPCDMERIIVHWTAGTWDVSDNDCSHYHFIIDKDGKGVRGDNPVSGNARENPTGPVTSHVKNFNTGSIGISVAAMGEAVESPFDAGPWPITEPQWEGLLLALTELSDFYGIPATPTTILMHGEVQENCGVAQEGKWDIGRLPWTDAYKTSRQVGDYMRSLLPYSAGRPAPAIPPYPTIVDVSLQFSFNAAGEVTVELIDAGQRNGD